MNLDCMSLRGWQGQSGKLPGGQTKKKLIKRKTWHTAATPAPTDLRLVYDHAHLQRDGARTVIIQRIVESWIACVANLKGFLHGGTLLATRPSVYILEDTATGAVLQAELLAQMLAMQHIHHYEGDGQAARQNWT